MNLVCAFVVCLLVSSIGCSNKRGDLHVQGQGVERTYVNPSSASKVQGAPFSGAVKVGNTVYLSGMIGRDSDGQIPDTAEEEARLVLDQVKAALQELGMTMNDLVSVQVFCSDVAHYDAFNSVYRTYFEDVFPARAFVGSGALLFDARFEVQSIAVRR